MEQKREIVTFCPEEVKTKAEGVTYPECTRVMYYSATCEKERPVNILLPANYDANKKYPLLFVMHGIFEDENSMTFNTTTITNLIARGEVKEMIVAFPFMFASKTKEQCKEISEENIEDYNNFINDLVNDLLPYIKEHYSVAEGRENTAIVGFSLGGRESLAMSFMRQDLFGYVGAIAPAPGLVPGKDWAMEHKGQFTTEQVVYDKQAPKFLMICVGDSDKIVGQFPASYHALFEQNQVEHVWWEIPGSDHGDPAISSGVYNFCRNIF